MISSFFFISLMTFLLFCLYIFDNYIYTHSHIYIQTENGRQIANYSEKKETNETEEKFTDIRM